LETNPYQPPTAPVADVTEHGPPPALWNPNAAANWCLLLSPAFGAYLHMRNWQALGDADKARVNFYWVVGVIVVLFGTVVASMLVPESKVLDASTRLLGLGMLVGWYVSSAKVQAKFVKDRFGTDYPRRGWAVPILVTLGCFVALVLALAVVAIVIGLARG
jgi:hypothetical protein